MSHAIAVENLVKRYGRVQAVDGLSFQVGRGTTCALLGGNGAGKTTTLAILLASHNMVEVRRICHQVLMMKTGRMVDRGSPPELIARYGRSSMEEVFLDVARAEHRAAEVAVDEVHG